MVRTIRKSRGFTLIEILIVVIILGILAAIVIPQFSSASNDARKSNVQTTVQTLRSQIALYKLQHQDALPDLVTNWNQITMKTDVAGSTTPAVGVQTFGPYMQDTPVNSLNSRAISLCLRVGNRWLAVAPFAVSAHWSRVWCAISRAGICAGFVVVLIARRMQRIRCTVNRPFARSENHLRGPRGPCVAGRRDLQKPSARK